MAKHLVTVVIPTLHAGEDLQDTLASLAGQSFVDFDIILVDNSGERRAASFASYRGLDLTVLPMESNVGYGAAINRALAHSGAPLVAVLNDDAPVHVDWLQSLVETATTFPEYGMFSCQIRLSGTEWLDSTGMLLSRDGSSIQRAHRKLWEGDRSPAETLLPSGCAALYRRKALEEVTPAGSQGPFDESFWLYCEDTDLGLRLLWQGWWCRYVRDAIVEHRYSRSAGPISSQKAYLVERNRLYVVLKNFPLTDAIAAMSFAPLRYFLHVAEAVRGSGKTGAFARSKDGWKLPWLVLKAHIAVVGALPHLLRERRRIRMGARASKTEFRDVIHVHRASLREVARH